MGDMGDMYRDWKVLKKEKKCTNKERILNFLTTNGISYVTKNEGSHLIFFIGEERFDIWPTTNKVSIGNRYYQNAYKFLLGKIKYD